jgi:hypothetical protein
MTRPGQGGSGPLPGPAVSGPALVTLDVFGVPVRTIPGALMRMAAHRLPLRSTPGLEFHKLLGTGAGRTFTMRDSDPRHWAVLSTWSDVERAEDFAGSSVMRSWKRISEEHLHIAMTPIISRGLWSGQEPFGQPHPSRTEGPIAAITRARIKPSQWPTFWRQVPAVSADLVDDPGLLFSLGIGEAPVGLQGTFSLWRNHKALTDFAQRRNPHREVIAQTIQRNWYAEELFARFRVEAVRGEHAGVDVAARLGSSQ